jgi:hypothetical protein
MSPFQKTFEKSLLKTHADKPAQLALPAQGLPIDAILQQMTTLSSISPLQKRVDEFKVSNPFFLILIT